MFKPAMKNVQATHIDFGFLKGVISSNPLAMPSNIDMVFERNCNFLFGEWKRPNEKISRGQEILLFNLAKNDRNTVLVIEGDTDNNEVNISKINLISKTGTLKIGNSLEDFKCFLNAWYQRVNS